MSSWGHVIDYFPTGSLVSALGGSEVTAMAFCGPGFKFHHR